MKYAVGQNTKETGDAAVASLGRGDDDLATENQLATHWKCSPQKLRKDRLEGVGCPYIRVGRAIRYRWSDIRATEQANRFQSTAQYGERSNG